MTGQSYIYFFLFLQIYGMYTVKLALAIVLAGGISKTNKAGFKILYRIFKEFYKLIEDKYSNKCRCTR